MNAMIALIQQKYGEMCRLCPPLAESQYAKAEALLPADLFELLKISNGVPELMTHPKVDDGEPFVIGSILYAFEDMLTESQAFKALFGADGLVIAGNGAGGYFVVRPDGTICLYEYVGEEGELYAENLRAFLSRW